MRQTVNPVHLLQNNNRQPRSQGPLLDPGNEVEQSVTHRLCGRPVDTLVFCTVWYIHVNWTSCHRNMQGRLLPPSSIRKYISRHTAEILWHAFITYRLDFCNSLVTNYQDTSACSICSGQNSCAYTKTWTYLTSITGSALASYRRAHNF